MSTENLPVSKLEIILAASHAADEIKRLRRINEILTAKVEVLDLFARIVPQDRFGVPMGEDPAWRLTEIIEQLQTESNEGTQQP